LLCRSAMNVCRTAALGAAACLGLLAADVPARACSCVPATEWVELRLEELTVDGTVQPHVNDVRGPLRADHRQIPGQRGARFVRSDRSAEVYALE
jgi:hypothetical protein